MFSSSSCKTVPIVVVVGRRLSNRCAFVAMVVLSVVWMEYDNFYGWEKARTNSGGNE